MKKCGDFSIGSSVWPGLSKVIEECGEVVQVGGKLIATGGNDQHYDGSDLRCRLMDELADVSAAIQYMLAHNTYDWRAFEDRIQTKLQLFNLWHDENVTNVES